MLDDLQLVEDPCDGVNMLEEEVAPFMRPCLISAAFVTMLSFYRYSQLVDIMVGALSEAGQLGSRTSSRLSMSFLGVLWLPSGQNSCEVIIL